MTVLFDFQTHTHTKSIKRIRTALNAIHAHRAGGQRRPAAISGDQRRSAAASGGSGIWNASNRIELILQSVDWRRENVAVVAFNKVLFPDSTISLNARLGRGRRGSSWRRPHRPRRLRLISWIYLNAARNFPGQQSSYLSGAFSFSFLIFFLGGKERKKKKKGDVFSAVYRRFWCYSRLSFPLDNRIGTGDFATVSPPVAPEISKRPFVKKKKKKRNQYGHFFVVDFCFQLVGLVRYDCDKHWHISLGSIHFDSALIRLDLTGLDGRLDFRTVRLYLIRLFLISFRLSIDSLCPTWIQFSNFIGSPESGHVPSVHCRLEFVLSNEKSTGFEQTWSELNSIASQWTPSWR